MMQAGKKCKKTERKPKGTISDCNSWFLFPITEQDEKVLRGLIGTASTGLQDDLSCRAPARCFAPRCKHKADFQHETSQKYGMTFSGDSCGSSACN